MWVSLRKRTPRPGECAGDREGGEGQHPAAYGVAGTVDAEVAPGDGCEKARGEGRRAGYAREEERESHADE